MASSFCQAHKVRCIEHCPESSEEDRTNKHVDRLQALNTNLELTWTHHGIAPELETRHEQHTNRRAYAAPIDILTAVDAFAMYSSSNEGLELSRVDSTPDESDAPSTPFGYGGLDSFVSSQEEPAPLEVTSKCSARTDNVKVTNDEAWLDENTKTELTELFFDEVYPNIPIIHKSRYYASLKLSPQLQPPLCLRFAMWALVAVQNQKWSAYANWLYEKARAYLEADESQAPNSEVLNVAHVQCWSLIATYESYMFQSLRTWNSIRRAAALAHVLHLHTIDENEDSMPALLPETQDPEEIEERRRAFWSAFNSDRWISSTTGFPMTISDSKITTKLPSSETSFNSGLSQQTQSLDDVLEMGFDPNTSLYGARAVLACILGRIMRHIESAKSPAKKSDTTLFWAQHSELDSLLSRVSSSRGSDLRPSSSTADLKLWVLDMWLHGLKICLHQTAIDRATKESNYKQYAESLSRCRNAADHIVRSIRSIAHLETRKMDPFTASCVYMAGTVLIQSYANGTSRTTDIDDLRFLQHVLEIMHKHWKVTEIFITQFRDDIANSGINLLITPNAQSTTTSKKRIGNFETSNRHRRIKSEAEDGHSG